MSLTFPYQYGFIDNRKIPYPIIPITLNTIRGKRPYAFIMDTGADDSTLPYIMIQLLGIKERTLKKSAAQGIGKELVTTWGGNVTIMFGNETFDIPCSFVDHDNVPFLLGKTGIFDRFNILFDNNQQMTVFEKRK